MIVGGVYRKMSNYQPDRSEIKVLAELGRQALRGPARSEVIVKSSMPTLPCCTCLSPHLPRRSMTSVPRC